MAANLSQTSSSLTRSTNMIKKSLSLNEALKQNNSSKKRACENTSREAYNLGINNAFGTLIPMAVPMRQLIATSALVAIIYCVIVLFAFETKRWLNVAMLGASNMTFFVATFSLVRGTCQQHDLETTSDNKTLTMGDIATKFYKLYK